MMNRFTNIASNNEDDIMQANAIDNDGDNNINSNTDESNEQPKEPETPSNNKEDNDKEQSEEPQLSNKNSSRVVFAVDSNGLAYSYAPINPDKYSSKTGYNLDNIRKDIITAFPEMADVDASDTKRWEKAMQEYSVLHFNVKRLPIELLLDKIARQ